MSENSYRNRIVQLVKSEFIGPCPDENPVEDGEEVIERRHDADSPLSRYSVGILYPQMRILDELGEIGIDDGGNDEMVEEDEDEDNNPPSLETELQGASADDEPQDDPVSLSNTYHQSAASITLRVAPNCSGIRAIIAYATYTKSSERDGGKVKTKYRRCPHQAELPFSSAELPDGRRQLVRALPSDSEQAKLQLIVTSRTTSDPRTKGMLTFSLVNVAQSSEGHDDTEKCAFQTEMSIFSSEPLLPILDSPKDRSNDFDYWNNQLLYRNTLTYGIGHGCAACWDQSAKSVHEVRIDFMPSYEVRPVVPGAPHLVFDMMEMSTTSNKSQAIVSLTNLCSAYEAWIAEIEQRTVELPPDLVAAATSNIKSCKECLLRMKEGVRLLQSDGLTYQAFALMNEAMLLQQLHYRLPLAKWEGGKNGGYVGLAVKPILHDCSTWPTNGVFGRWRTFQIAFILMNLKSMRDEDCDERNIIDLIWFPTGGGKTEAYLGLTAFTLFIRRLLDRDNAGVTVLMRYTLRLLTTQQFERASSLICACETIRERMPEVLGTEKFSIGLWVGNSTSPNRREDASEQLKKMRTSESSDNPFVLLKCPWCGAQMGIVDEGSRRKRDRVVLGYENVRHGARRRGGVHFRYVCSNPSCHFSEHGAGELPIFCIDDDIYQQRPSLVIGTVDKFAAISTTSATRNLFGRGDNPSSPPDLIIQDELHLISGPLGSMVGFYETAIDVLCTDANNHRAKIVGSTATISHAKEQCASLYGRSPELVEQFPPSGIDADDSFFAVEESDPERPGRLYVGLCAPGCSMAMSVINLFASLLLSHDVFANDESPEVLDGYKTNLAYFNSLRELGQAATWISGNIAENLEAMQRRRWRKDPNCNGRYASSITSCELTSRVPSNEIPPALKRLETPYIGSNSKDRAVDICLATNMISVGVDISRLALMTIDGQPKTTSEYIQASSRVGRGSNPGLVFTIYSPTKPRDKSHYEDFQRYHSRLYCNVEPTSVTPFSAPVRDRALRALLVALVRQLCPIKKQDDPRDVSPELFKRVVQIIVDRTSVVDNSEVEPTKKQAARLIDEWASWRPQEYMSKPSDEITPLIMRTDSKVNKSWNIERIWEVPSSMRSVDASCVVRLLSGKYYGGGNDGI
ncbi:helicase-related protein [Enorma phocaeensis]|uniref:helicase-related protein n=1 Tax=Enorma phocaeensis TaxID=1871019 RepID=UPI001957588D|nr:helicase-related protein [Enorma phocaeensis]MBM6953768.1 hypothetical protein [Enorma phocaeensis]